MSDGSKKQLKYLEIGDQVKTLDRDGKVIDTDFIMMMDISTEESKVKLIITLNYYFLIASVKSSTSEHNNQYE
jgi:hypothetical protein